MKEKYYKMLIIVLVASSAVFGGTTAVFYSRYQHLKQFDDPDLLLFQYSGSLSPCAKSWAPSPAGQPTELPQVVISYPSGLHEYASAILRICETALSKYIEVFGMSTSNVHIFINIGSERLLMCYDPGQYRIYNYIRSLDDYRPPPGGPHNVYGFIHEIGHLVLSTDNGVFNEGWAHYAASKIVDEVYQELGDTAWPQPYNYSETEGKERLLKDIADAQPRTLYAAAKVLHIAEQEYGPSIFKSAMNRMLPTYVGTYHYPLYDLDDFKSALVELTGDTSLSNLFEDYGF